MKFELNEKESELAEQFKGMCHMIMGYSANSVEDMKVLSFNYIFSPSGIGQACAIECEELDVGISLTDYSSW